MIYESPVSYVYNLFSLNNSNDGNNTTGGGGNGSGGVQLPSIPG